MTSAPPGQLQASDFIFESASVRLFQVQDIVCLQPKQRGTNYTEVTLANGKRVTIRKPIAHIIPRLPNFFFLCRRGWVINLHHIRDMASIDRRSVDVTLSDLSHVLISRNQLAALARQRGL